MSDDYTGSDAARDMLETNRSVSAQVRDDERKIAEDGAAGRLKLVDLRTVPPAEWDRWLNYDVTIPPEVAAMLTDEATTIDLLLIGQNIDALTDEVAKFHGVTEPYYIELSPVLCLKGRTWSHVPEAAPYLSGFLLAKE